MASVYRGSVADSLGRLFASGTAGSVGEAQLLERFITQGDPTAFEAILHRHGPMVLGVCRRVLDDPNEVDDAFQATFLILVKKAASIRDRDVLATWLYGVARRVAVRARVSARRRRSRETVDAKGVAIARSRADLLETSELRALLDAELERLPVRYRTALVLCDLEGQTHEQAAAELSCPVGTVKSRLSRGRQRLRARLVRRGVVPAGALASFVVAEPARAVSGELLNTTARAAAQLACGKTIVAGTFSVAAANLMHEGLRSMTLSKLKLAAGAAAAIALAVAGVEALVLTAPAQPALALQQENRVTKPVPAPPKVDEPSRQAEPGSERFVLDNNGLTVLLRPIKGTSSIALAVLYSIGSDHDDEGRSGMHHLLEHLYVTAAAGQTKARTAQEFAGRYPQGANAQTGDRYTLFATVFPRDDLEAELQDCAARMGTFNLRADDLARERPRMLAEVDNMFGNFPALAALNHARELVRPTPLGGRRGGLPAHINAIEAWYDLLADKLRYNQPQHAILAIAGAVDPRAIHKQINKYFGQLDGWSKVQSPHEPGPPRLGGDFREIKVRSPQPDARSTACLAYPAPQPGSDLYAPFLVLAARLSAAGARLGGNGPTGSPVYFAPLDDGAIVAVSTEAKTDEDAKAVFKRLEAFVAETIEPKLGLFERMTTRQLYSFSLGLVDLPDMILANNPYGVAFSLGRREQLDIKPAELKTALDHVTNDQLRRAAKEVFAADRHAGVFAVVEK